MMMHQTMMGFRRDPDLVQGKHFERDLLRRVFGLARPYRKDLIGFLIVVVLASGVAVIPPLLFGALIGSAIPDKNKTLVTLLALGAVGLAIATAFLSLVQRWYSARVGEGLIYDMRVKLFDH
ncbi:MAG TPA: ABC transporter transmembrane domain-containing protein, partial [Acidimicrobiia bacterium]